jgi:hypothetical protein
MYAVLIPHPFLMQQQQPSSFCSVDFEAVFHRLKFMFLARSTLSEPAENGAEEP